MMIGKVNLAVLLISLTELANALPQGGRPTPNNIIKCHREHKTLLSHEAIRVKIINDGTTRKTLDICVVDRTGQAQPTSYTLSSHEGEFTFRKGQPYALYVEATGGSKCKGKPVVGAVSFEDNGHVSISQIGSACK
jgi:hypothetical protein